MIKRAFQVLSWGDYGGHNVVLWETLRSQVSVTTKESLHKGEGFNCCSQSQGLKDSNHRHDHIWLRMKYEDTLTPKETREREEVGLAALNKKEKRVSEPAKPWQTPACTYTEAWYLAGSTSLTTALDSLIHCWPQTLFITDLKP